MIIDLTSIWSGPYTVTEPEMLQSLSGTIMVSFGAELPATNAGRVVDGRLALTPGQVFWARAADTSRTARFDRSVGGAPVSPTVPAAFTAGQWTLSDTPSPGGDTLTLNLTALPSDGGSAITALQFRRNSGTATAMTGTGVGSRVITVPATTAADIQVRAVNAIGAGPWSDTKTATPTVNAPAFTEYTLAAMRQVDQPTPVTVQEGAAITFIWDVRFSTNGTEFCLPNTGHMAGITMTAEPNGKELRLTGFANAAQRNALLLHHQHLPSTQSPGFHQFCQLYVKNTNLPNPLVGPGRPPGLEVQTTVWNAPVGVT